MRCLDVRPNNRMQATAGVLGGGIRGDEGAPAAPDAGRWAYRMALVGFRLEKVANERRNYGSRNVHPFAGFEPRRGSGSCRDTGYESFLGERRPNRLVPRLLSIDLRHKR